MSSIRKTHIPRYTALNRYAKMLGFGEIYTKIDKKTGLHAIIAVHSNKLGPAIGGCRFYTYSAPELALKDALRLSYGMTLKAAACGLNHGGGKAVILKPKNAINAEERKAPGRIDEDPSHSTARGIFRAMEAAIKFKLNQNDFSKIHVAVQGVGHAGYHLVKELVRAGAKVTIADINQHAIEQCIHDLGVTSVPVDEIEKLPCDIFSPCAMGGTITHDYILQTKAKIIAGSANNQLAHHKNAFTMQAHNILYLPDFLINSGGLINAAMTYTYQDLQIAYKRVDKIYDATMTMLERAAQTGKTPTVIAEEIAFERLKER